MIKLSLPTAIASLLGKREHEDYIDIKQAMAIKDLYKLMGLSNSPMLYNYMSGKTEKIEPERALVLLDKFDILVDLWDSADTLRADAANAELSAQIAREPIKGLIEELIEVEAKEDEYALRRGLRKLIARYY